MILFLSCRFQELFGNVRCRPGFPTKNLLLWPVFASRGSPWMGKEGEFRGWIFGQFQNDGRGEIGASCLSLPSSKTMKRILKLRRKQFLQASFPLEARSPGWGGLFFKFMEWKRLRKFDGVSYEWKMSSIDGLGTPWTRRVLPS